jgi:ABC-type multidrug transport system ATPase subunit
VTLVRAVEVSRRDGDVLALDRLSLHVAAGELVGLLGPNDAGKNTLLSLLTGLRRPGFVGNLAPYLPTGGAVRLMWSAVGDFSFDLSATLAPAGWTIALAGVAV